MRYWVSDDGFSCTAAYPGGVELGVRSGRPDVSWLRDKRALDESFPKPEWVDGIGSRAWRYHRGPMTPEDEALEVELRCRERRRAAVVWMQREGRPSAAKPKLEPRCARLGPEHTVVLARSRELVARLTLEAGVGADAERRLLDALAAGLRDR